MKILIIALALLVSGGRTANLFDISKSKLIDRVEAALQQPAEFPMPADGGGGPVHERHKANYMLMSDLAQAWQFTYDSRYLGRLRQMLLGYADLYPGLGYHPIVLSGTPGRLFWQTLNECVWLVHVAPAYETVRDKLSEADRKRIEDDLIRPMADFVMQGTPDNRANLATFNSIHNHGTWALAAVGLSGFAMKDDSLVKMALYGTDLSGEHGGFLQQMDLLFSPQGYYTEGAYYQRYAIWPFMIFAQALNSHMPELKVFERRDGILLKAVDALLQLSYRGELFPFNDAVQKDLSAQELVCAVDVAYGANPSRKDLLSIVRDYHGTVLLTADGKRVAKDLAAGQARPYEFKSVLLGDGADGKQGAYAVIRTPGGSALGFKATSQGMGHGHFDRLGLIYYDNGNEVLSDYGSARFVNVDAKYHGHYTPENKSYAKQTIAHNALVVDGKSQFGGSVKKADPVWPSVLGCDFSDPSFQWIGAREEAAYKGVTMTRWTAVADLPFLQYPLVVDLLEADSPKAHAYDLPFHYNGHMISLNVPYERALTQMVPFGSDAGYQHLWTEATAAAAAGTTTFTWMTADRMYSLSTATDSGMKVALVRAGANDPSFHLRPEPAFILRSAGSGRRVFASCLESHGTYDNTTEQSANLTASCTSVRIVSDDAAALKVEYGFVGGKVVTVTVDKKNNIMKIEK